MQSIASYIFIYFACLTPIITFGGLLGDATENRIAAIESLISGLIVGVTYGFLSGQPLTILGSTGPILVFETIMFDFCKSVGFQYLPFRFWDAIQPCREIRFITVVLSDKMPHRVGFVNCFLSDSLALPWQQCSGQQG